MNWQPIETAKKDGTKILLYQPGEDGGIDTAFWEDTTYQTWETVNKSTKKLVTVQDGYWHTGSEISFWCPTHWMPMPDPPTAAAGTER